MEPSVTSLVITDWHSVLVWVKDLSCGTVVMKLLLSSCLLTMACKVGDEVEDEFGPPEGDMAVYRGLIPKGEPVRISNSIRANIGRAPI